MTRAAQAPATPPTPDVARRANEVQRVRALTMQLIEQHPFWGYLLLQMKVQYDPTLPALGTTDGVHRVWLNPDRTTALDIRELGFVLLHLLGHQLLAVTARRQGRDPALWAQATDYAVNRLIADFEDPAHWQEPMYRPPPGALLDPAFERLTVEAIYELLVARSPRPPVPDLIPEISRRVLGGEDPGEAHGTTLGSGPVTLVATGEAAVAEWSNQLLPDHGGGIDVHFTESPRGADAIHEELLDRLEQAVLHYEAHGSRGEVPHGIERLVAHREAKVPWRRLLWRYVTPVLARDDYNPRRPNRRWLSEGVYLPGLGGEEVPLVVVALDTSGSMTKEALAAACAEIQAIAEGVAELQLVVADAAVQEVVVLDNLDAWLRKRRPKGGGGTDHRPVFQWVVDQRLRPDVFIGITDLETALPEAAPGYPVLWVTPARHGAAPWGQVLVMD